MDTISLAMIKELRGVALYNLYSNLNPNPNILPEYIANCGNIAGTLGSYFAASGSGSVTLESGTGIAGTNSIKVNCVASANSGAVSSTMPVSGNTQYTFYTLVRGQGNFKNILFERKENGVYAQQTHSSTIALNGYHVVRTTVTTHADAVDIKFYWVTADPSVMSFNILACSCKVGAY